MIRKCSLQCVMALAVSKQMLRPNCLEILTSHANMRYKSKKVQHENNIPSLSSKQHNHTTGSTKPTLSGDKNTGSRKLSETRRTGKDESLKNDCSKKKNARTISKMIVNSKKSAYMPHSDVNFVKQKNPSDNKGTQHKHVRVVPNLPQAMIDENQTKIKRILQELELFRAWNNDLPCVISHQNWRTLVKCDPESKRLYYYRFLAKEEYNLKSRQRKNKVILNMEVPNCQNGSLVYMDGSEHLSTDVESLKGSIWRQRVHEAHKSRGVHSLLCGAPIILDVGSKMNSHEVYKVFNIIRYCNKINLHHKEPMQMMVTGCADKPELKQRLEYFADDFYLKHYDEEFINMFEKKQLVYLLPYGQPIPFFNKNAIYVIQAEDSHYDTPQTALWKAKEYGIQYGSLPFVRYPG